ncbi:hypothetical protein [Aeoliella sp. SH292]|uniref:hypothetical protein n=1 Tax=Aeoliella sp. SH292 TaxID=3454464 RepID=UPI003F95E4D0
MDDLIVKFCEDRRSWLFVIGGTLSLVLVFLMPEVDDYVAVCNEETEVAEKLASAEQAAAMLPAFETRHAKQAEVVAQSVARTLTADNEADYRNTIVTLVRETGCQLRRLNISAASVRDWGQQDNPLEKTYNKKLKPTGFLLERRQVSLSLAGPSASVRRLVEQFEQQDKEVYVEGLELKPDAGDGRRVELNMELWYYTLARPAA